MSRSAGVNALTKRPGVPLGVSRTSLSGWWTGLLVIWVIGFSVYFYTRDFPNAPRLGDRPLNRTDVWQAAPLHLLDLVWPEQGYAATALAIVAGLPERLALWSLGGLILLAAYGYGAGLTQLLGFSAKEVPGRSWLALVTGLVLLSNLVLLTGLVGGVSAGVGWGLVTAGVLLALVLRRGSLWSGLNTVLQWVTGASKNTHHRTRFAERGLVWLAMLFGGVIVLGSLSPQTDFDVKEYHLVGPKEWWQQGQITFLPHNVYTGFPFLTEMFPLLGMELCRDWRWGSLVGQGVLGSFALVVAWGLIVAGQQWMAGPHGNTDRTGWLAAVIWLSTPWVVRISIISYAEGGLTLWTAATWLAVALWWNRVSDTESSDVPSPVPSGAGGELFGVHLVIGLLAGAAMAAKYTGFLLAVVPVVVVCSILALCKPLGTHSAAQGGSGRRAEVNTRVGRLGLTLTGLAVGLGLSIGPWLVRNVVWTGNPVYPLAGKLFGGVDWSPAWQQRWASAHAVPDYSTWNDWLGAIARQVVDVAVINDWQSGLLGALAPLSLLALWSPHKLTRCVVLGSWGLMAWIWCVWFFGTHHIDRFWVPLLPFAAWLAAVGVATVWGNPSGSVERRGWGPWLGRGVVGSSLLAGLVFQLVFTTSELVGYHVWWRPLAQAAEFTSRLTCPEIAALNARARTGERLVVLCVGEAEVFDAEFPVFYNTVFDQSLLEQWCRAEGPGQTTSGQGAGGQGATPIALRKLADMQGEFQRRGITHVLVNWREVLRYRTTYGYTEFVTPARLTELVQSGLLKPGETWDAEAQIPLDSLGPAERQQVDGWMNEVAVPAVWGNPDWQGWFPGAELYAVEESPLELPDL